MTDVNVTMDTPSEDNNNQADGSRALHRTPSWPSFGTDPENVSPAGRVRHLLSETSALEGSEDSDAVMSELSLHALFCQMDVLCHFDDGMMGWKEYARWLKYEEKVESGDRWSKPHVPTASLHALFELKKAMTEGSCSVLLDMEATHGCVHQIAELLTKEISKVRGLTAGQTKQITEILLRPHKHKHRKAKNRKQVKKDGQKEGGQKADTSVHDKSVADTTVTSTKPLLGERKRKDKQSSLGKLLDREDSREASALTYQYPGRARPDELQSHKPNKKLMRKIPGGSEAANILIGHVDFLEEPLIAFIRLQSPHLLADLTEVAVPTRFLFLVLGPHVEDMSYEYEELGRGMASLLIDTVFCEVAYKASCLQDLIDGIEEYIDDLTVLPPSIWDPSNRLDPPEHTMSMEKIKKRLMDSSRRAPESEAFHLDQSAGQDVSLSRTGRLFGGMLKDMKRRYPLYWSDIKDGFHPQCIASILFLYFACITPIVTFGGLLGGATNGQMGTMETMVAGAMCGLIYSAFAGQPLTIVGATGPLLIFESILYYVCSDFGINYLVFRLYCGLWIVLFLLLFVAFDLSALVKYITRFTEESFAVLISLIFIFEAFKKLGGIWHTHPIHIHTVTEGDSYKCHCEHPGVDYIETVTERVSPLAAGNTTTNGTSTVNETIITPVPTVYNWTSMVQENCITFQQRIVVDVTCISEKNCTDHHWSLDGPACGVDTITHSVPDVFFLCCFLFLGTFVIAYFLRTFKGSTFFPSIVRSTLSDFAVLIAIVICTVVDLLMELDTPKLKVPNKFETTVAGRGWVVNPVALTQWYVPILAVIPGLLATILLFLDQQITAVIVNRKEHKLKKGHGYHLDLFVLAVIVLLCSLFGLPWFVAATVRSITHVRSLIRESQLRAPGEKPQFLGVREQRLTGISIHILIGLSIFLTSILQHVPMAVLYGVFLYMGVTSLGGVQFVDRILILFMPEKYQPDHIYLRHVTTFRIHVFTLIQLACMIAMWIVKSISVIAIAFPIMILGLCFVRKALDFLFTKRELYWLDHLLPEVTRKSKEDQQKMEDKEVATDTFNGCEKRKPLEDGLMLHENWDKMIALRDYGVGRKTRKRKLSQMVIDRYHTRSDEESGDEVKDSGSHLLISQPFKDRHFSLT